MRIAPLLLTLVISTTLLAACAAGRADSGSGQEPDLVALANAMNAIARGEADISVALAPFVTLPADVPDSANLRFDGFRDVDGHVLRELEIRVRNDGIDGAPLVIAYFEPDPCINLDPLAARLGASELFGIPPSPHAPAGTPGVRGYTARYGDEGSLSVSANTDAPDCVIGISARRPASSR